MVNNIGKIYGISVGPGDPELMTIKAVRKIEEVQVVAYPVDKQGNSVALNIAKQTVNLEGKELIGLHFPMTRDEDRLKKAWASITDEISDCLNAGKNVAFLSLGDVSLFSTWGYLRSNLIERGYTTESIAGVTAMCAVAAALGRDLTTRDEPLTVIPAAVSDDELERLLNGSGTKVLMKAGKSLNDVIGLLKDKDLLDKAAMGINCGMPGERLYLNLENIEDVEGYFATILL